MKVNSNRDISFKSVYTSKTVKKGLELAADNGALFAAGATVAFSAVRPLSIWLTPKTDKENRKLASAKSITSSLIGFGLMLLFSIPLAKSMKNIDKNPYKYLKSDTIKNLRDEGKDITNSKGYIFSTQLFKLGLSTVAAIPKAIMTAAGIPYIMGMFSKKAQTLEKNQSIKPETETGKVSEISFKSKNPISSAIAKTINNNAFQQFANKFKDSNFPMHIAAITDALSTLTFIHQIEKNKKIETERKRPLEYNAGISTALCIGAGYVTDKALDKPTENFIAKYRKINKNEKYLEKQVQGIKIAKPLIILGTIYYILIPFISTFLAEKTDKNRLS